MLQIGENPSMYFGFGEDEVDGQTISENNDYNEDSQP